MRYFFAGICFVCEDTWGVGPASSSWTPVWWLTWDWILKLAQRSSREVLKLSLQRLLLPSPFPGREQPYLVPGGPLHSQHSPAPALAGFRRLHFTCPAPICFPTEGLVLEVRGSDSLSENISFTFTFNLILTVRVDVLVV